MADLLEKLKEKDLLAPATAEDSLHQSWQQLSDDSGLFPELALSEQDILNQEPIDRRQFLVKQLSTICVNDKRGGGGGGGRRRRRRRSRRGLTRSSSGCGDFGNPSPTSYLLQGLRAHMPKDCTVRTCASQALAERFVVFTDQHREAYDDEIVGTIERDDIYTLKLWHDHGRSLQAASADDDTTLLHVACRKGLLDVVEYLVKDVGVSGWVKNKAGLTPWHDAFSCNPPSLEFLDFLIEYDVDLLFVRDERGYCPLDLVTRDLWEEWRNYLDSKDLTSLVPKRRDFLDLKDATIDNRDALLEFVQQAVSSEEQKAEEAARRATERCQRNTTTSVAQRSDCLRKMLKARLIEALHQKGTVGSSDFEEGLSTLPTEMLAAVLSANDRLTEQIDKFQKKEESFLFVDGKMKEISEQYERRQAEFADAMLAVQKSAEEVRRNENIMEIAQQSLREAQRTHVERKATYSSAKAEYKALKKRRGSTVSMDSITEATILNEEQPSNAGQETDRSRPSLARSSVSGEFTLSSSSLEGKDVVMYK